MFKKQKMSPQMYLTVIFYFAVGISIFYLKLRGVSFGIIDTFFKPIFNYFGKLNNNTIDALARVVLLLFFGPVVIISYAAVFHKVRNELAGFLYKFLTVYVILVVVGIIYLAAKRFILT